MFSDYLDTIAFVSKYDPQVGEAMQAELKRQRRNLELIASENIVSPAVMAAMGSVLTNKYAEGYPGRRYYGGCECVDVVENIAIERAKELFGAEAANVQPHSGAQANMAAYSAILEPGDTVMGMSLADGGHLTHGSPVNASGKLYKFVPYGVDPDGFIDYDGLERKAREIKPKLIVAGASAYPRIIDFERIGALAKEIGAYFMVDMAHIAGLVAAASLARALCRYRHHHHSQDPQGAEGRSYPLDRGACARNKQSDIPRQSGRPAHAHHCRKGGLLRRGSRP